MKPCSDIEPPVSKWRRGATKDWKWICTKLHGEVLAISKQGDAHQFRIDEWIEMPFTPEDEIPPDPEQSRLQDSKVTPPLLLPEPEQCLAEALYLLQLVQQDLNISRTATVWPRLYRAAEVCRQLEVSFRWLRGQASPPPSSPHYR